MRSSRLLPIAPCKDWGTASHSRYLPVRKLCLLFALVPAHAREMRVGLNRALLQAGVNHMLRQTAALCCVKRASSGFPRESAQKENNRKLTHTHKKKTPLPQRVEVVPSVWLSFVAGWCHGSSRRCRVLLFRFPHALSATSAATSIGSEKTHFN